jgi:anti-sigma-K factor RskA
MVAKASVDAQSIAREFAGSIRDEPVVRTLWLAHHCDVVELFVVTDESDMDVELRIADAFGELIERHPGTDLQLWMLDPRHFASDAAFRAAVPKRAAEVPLRD